ncbi:rhodanese-like domain-containing protein [Psychroflexus halocasei]|uniref:Rhodanese-related sulfurtransferase n=1 Tax=Psychroflexus halocasei TaxID=908615 RepID=A0A1H3ZDS4_9FLAO|nr:rhodanese-like domain-containing protein [Psychroflexus halocasei]SEA21785.1 Rhodanese-related sulfurtransferase [Psychroflexus halocasei]
MLNTQVEAKKLNLKALSVEDFASQTSSNNVYVLDTRDPEIFRVSFIPNSLNLGIGNNFAPWMTRIFPDRKTKIVLVCDESCLSQCLTLLNELDYHNILGYLDGGFQSWENSSKKTDSIERLNVDEFSKACLENKKVVDVRHKAEYYSQHVKNAENISLDDMIEQKQSFEKEPCILYCQGGYRSMIAASLLKIKGFDNVKDVEGGFSEIIEHDIELTPYRCPTNFQK